MGKQKQIRDKLLNILKKQNVCCNGNECGRCDYDGDNCVEERLADTLIESGLIIPENAVVMEIKRVGAYKVLSDETPKGWKKEDLIEQIRILEHNWAAAEESLNNSAKNSKKIITEQKAEIERLTEVRDDFRQEVTTLNIEKLELQKQVDELKGKICELVADKCNLVVKEQQAIKDTAEKFAERVKGETDHGQSAIWDSTVDEICKEITEGKKDGRM